MNKFKVTVAIPTKNAMPGFKRVLDRVMQQETPWEYQVIIVDSGSKDGTCEHIRSVAQTIKSDVTRSVEPGDNNIGSKEKDFSGSIKHSNSATKCDSIQLIEIKPDEFGHGRTRNLAIENADSEFVAFLTHDAVPFNENWLVNLIQTAEKDDRIAGVFGRHVAYDHSSPFMKKELDDHFSGFLEHPLIVHRDIDKQKYLDDEGWRQFLHFYSDNNSLIRKAVWYDYPYPDVDFAEDQIWARKIIEVGFAKAYAPEAIVIHSHDYGLIEQLRRAFDESRNFKKYFGYELSPYLFQTIRTMYRSFLESLVIEIDASTYGQVNLRQRLARGFQRMFLVAGYFLGTNYEKLPVFLTNSLSLDNKLFKS